jgi:hypothetical protein
MVLKSCGNKIKQAKIRLEKAKSIYIVDGGYCGFIGEATL